MSIAAFYFDGKTSRQQSAILRVQDGIASVEDELGRPIRSCPLHQLRVSERFKRAARKVSFTDGAYLEILDQAAFSELLQRTYHHDSLVVRMQQNWRASLAALLTLILVLLLGYLYALPALSGLIANVLPAKLERSIGVGSLEFLDAHLLAPTQLPLAQRSAISERFQALGATLPNAPHYEIIFRRSRIGPNALALPSGQIVLTDEIVQLLDDDDAVMGVLAHELGHLYHRHLMQRLIQGSVMAAGASLLFGDVSLVLANVPTVLLDLKYSRDFERQADDYALALFLANGLSRSKLASVFEKLETQAHGGNAVPAYLATHPGNAERIARILQAP